MRAGPGPDVFGLFRKGRADLRIAILGAGGFIGSHLVEHLIAAREHDVIGLDRASEKLAGLAGDGFTFIQADVRCEGPVVERMVRDADVVVDLIAHANPSLYVTAPLEVFELNFIQNLHIAKLCIQHGKRLIQYSSAEVYGKANSGTTYSEENTDSVFGPVHKQRWIYGSAKALLERVLYAYGRDGDLEYTIVRPFNFVGSRMDYLVSPNEFGGPRVFPHFMSSLLQGASMHLVDGGTVHRAFLHIADGTSAFQHLLDRRDEARNQIFNVGNPANNVTIRELAVLMCELYEELTGTRPTSRLVEISGQEFYGPGYEDSDRLPPDIAKIRAVGWEPKYDLRTTVRDAMQYYVDPKSAQDALAFGHRYRRHHPGHARFSSGPMPDAAATRGRRLSP